MVVALENGLKLTETDWEILGELRHGRNVAANLALEIDRHRKTVNKKLSYLLDYGLVEKIGPHEQSGLYELTQRGRLAYEHREKYHDDAVDFDAFLDEKLDASELDPVED
jgi:predicted transcriptional regulator